MSKACTQMFVRESSSAKVRRSNWYVDMRKFICRSSLANRKSRYTAHMKRSRIKSTHAKVRKQKIAECEVHLPEVGMQKLVSLRTPANVHMTKCVRVKFICMLYICMHVSYNYSLSASDCLRPYFCNNLTSNCMHGMIQTEA